MSDFRTKLAITRILESRVVVTEPGYCRYKNPDDNDGVIAAMINNANPDPQARQVKDSEVAYVRQKAYGKIYDRVKKAAGPPPTDPDLIRLGRAFRDFLIRIGEPVPDEITSLCEKKTWSENPL
jgi:hypothetical protein